MTHLLDWGVQVVLWLQQFSPTLDIPFKAFTFLGGKTFYLVFIPLVYWCVDRRTGARLFILLLFSAYLNAVAKVLVHQPRPFNYDPRVRAIVPAGGGGLPSGHTQNAVVVWGFLAAGSHRASAWLPAIILMICIPLSRVYLGVHFPTDLLGGYLLGALILIFFGVLGPRLEAWLAAKGFGARLLISLLVPMVLMLLNLSGDQSVLSTLSVLMGFGAGFVLERRLVGFSCAGGRRQKVLRYLVGFVVLFGLWAGLKAAFSGWEPAAFFRFGRYALVGLWGGLGAPWVFVRLKLAETESQGKSECGMLK